jgi:flagellar protein FlaG
LEKAITSAILIIASIVAVMALINAVIPAAGKSSGALLMANAEAADRISTDIEIIHASGNATTNKITVWVKNIGNKNIVPVTASDIIVTMPSDVIRLQFDSGCSNECWDFSIEEGGSDWDKTATVKFTLSTSVVTGVYNVKVSVVNAVSATKDFSV